MTPRHPFAVAVVALVADSYGIDADLLWSRQRGPTLCEARQLACWALREKTGWSYPELGRALCLDHSTVIHGVRKTCAKVRDGTGTRFLKPAYDRLATDGVTAAKPVVEAVLCPPSLVLSPSESGSPSAALSASFSASESGSKEPVSKPARKPRKAEPETPPPEHIAPTARQVEIANEKNIDLPVEIERFLNHHRAKGNVMARWTAGLTTWLLSPYPKALKGGGPGPGKPPPGANFNRLRALADQAEREEKRNAAQ